MNNKGPPHPAATGYLFESYKKTWFMTRKKLMVLANIYKKSWKSLRCPKMVDDRVRRLQRNSFSICCAGTHNGKTIESSGCGKDDLDVLQQEQTENLLARFLRKINFLLDFMYKYLKDNPQLQQDDLPIWLALKYKFKRLHVSNTPCRPSAVQPRDQDDPYDDAHPEGENSTKRQKTSEHETCAFGKSLSGQANESESGPSTSGNQEQLDDFDFWTDSYATNDDELPTEKVSQELVEEMSQTVDEAKLRKVVNKMLRQRCTSRDEHQYHIDQM
ncbi:hypothetical protein Tco_1412557 [Tanacetum coccineum]